MFFVWAWSVGVDVFLVGEFTGTLSSTASMPLQSQTTPASTQAIPDTAHVHYHSQNIHKAQSPSLQDLNVEHYDAQMCHTTSLT
jgi:hypothetical protein